MTRTVKFRLWLPPTTEESGQMISGDDLAFEEYLPLTQLLSQEKIMQWTGFLDFTGAEIYEGDIVLLECDAGDDDVAIVQWSDKDGAWMIAAREEFPREQFLGDVFDGYRVTVIGNVYANPELAAEVRGDESDG